MIDDLPAHPGPALIVAVGHNGTIGRDGDLPWHLPEDLAHFKAVTEGHHVILGATTWESIGRALPRRHLVVVSRRRLDLPVGVELATSPQAALKAALTADPSPLVAGGTSIYEALLPDAVRIIRTDVDVEVPDADAWFPPIDRSDWDETARWPGADERLTFRVLDRSGRAGAISSRDEA